jgi:hypothetical protein
VLVFANEGDSKEMAQVSPYPVDYQVEAQLTGRNRVTCAFRIILAIPHIILVGGPGIGGSGSFGQKGAGQYIGGLLAGGVLFTVAGLMSVISWFAIVFTGKMPQGLWEFESKVMRWRGRSNAYIALLRDEYPPFSFDDPTPAYPTTLTLPQYSDEERNRVTVGFRIILAIPQIIALVFIGIAWAITAFIGWLAILFTGAYPEGLYKFGIGYLRWSFRVESYMLLLHDIYPPFSLE